MLEGRIDLKKLKQAIKNNDSKGCRFIPAAAPKSAESYGYSNVIGNVTVLYALRSHMRGRLHMTKKETVVGPCEPNGRAIYPVTMDDQEKLIAQVCDDYLLEVSEEAA